MRTPVATLPDPGDVEDAAPIRVFRSSVTARALALVVVFLVLTISYASSLRIYFAQAHQIASVQAEISARQDRIGELNGQVAQWGDVSYVKAQARARLGWVMPGETGFSVIGPDGKPLGGGNSIASQTTTVAAPPDAWWAKLWGSVEAADKPAPVAPKTTSDKPVTTESKPKTR